MNKLKYFIASSVLFLTVFVATEASPPPPKDHTDYSFQQERMIVDNGTIFIISSFKTEDHVSSYTVNGSLLWNAPFHAKVLSWKLTDNSLIIFSKDRKGQSTYLTSLDRFTGMLVWQKPY